MHAPKPHFPGLLFLALLLPWLAANPLCAQSEPGQLRPILEKALHTPEAAAGELRAFLMKRVPELPRAANADAWKAEAGRIRRRLLDEVVFHGWPPEWVNAPLKVEDLGVAFTGDGYRVRRLRYEIVPGMQSVALLYEPASVTGKAPAVLNVNGHVGAPGKSVEYKQKRCINFARHGIYALNLEWLAFGELAGPENAHWQGAHLDLAGANELGLFYLAMRKGLDYLWEHPNVDRGRIAMTGLSGGGWQTIVLSALDERVAVAIPVAGYSALISRIERPADTGDLEQNATDFYVGQDYPQLTALRAPRPTLLIYNAEDDCCFRAPLVKPYIFDAIRPFFALYGHDADFAWHENTDPSNHNYQLDNRTQAYRFLARQWRLSGLDDETGVAGEVKMFDELRVGLPKENLTIVGLARKLADAIRREPVPEAGPARQAWAATERGKLRRVLRYEPATVAHAWPLDNTRHQGIESVSYRFEMSNHLSATGVWLSALAEARHSALTIVLSDKGRKEAAAVVSDRVNRGEAVLSLDVLFHGDAAPAHPVGFAVMISGTGARPLGLQAAQLAGVARWAAGHAGLRQVNVIATGMRSQAVALAAAALEPALFSNVTVNEGIPTLRRLMDDNAQFTSAPELFCLDLLKEFDLDRLALLASVH